MNTSSDTRSNQEPSRIETARQEPQTMSQTELVQLGKVSDTQGGWVGTKLDVGLGFITY